MVRRVILGEGKIGEVKHLMIGDEYFVRTPIGWVELSRSEPCLPENEINEEEAWNKIVSDYRKRMWKRYSRRRKND